MNVIIGEISKISQAKKSPLFTGNGVTMYKAQYTKKSLSNQADFCEFA